MGSRKFVPDTPRRDEAARNIGAEQMLAVEKVSIHCHEYEVPPFVEQELARLYGSLFSSLPFMRVYADIDSAHTYVVRKGNEITCTLLFHRDQNTVKVINEILRLNEEEIFRFARYVFDTFRQINEVSFSAVATNIGTPLLPCQQVYQTDDIVLSLPQTEDDYLARLGKATRKNIRHHLSRAKRTFPSFEHRVLLASEAEEQDIRVIIEFNRTRMQHKNKISSFDKDETERLVRLAKSDGMISLIKIDGQVRAGTIFFQVGDNYFSRINAHDPVYNDFRLGTLCCYLTILECIKRRGKEFHFLWGRYEYKYALLGVLQEFDRIAIYRSRKHYLLNAGPVMRNAWKSRIQQMKFRFLEAGKKEHSMAKSLLKFLRFVAGRRSG